MKSSKKLLALFTALSISTSAFTGLTPLVGAATEDDILWSDTFNNAAVGVFLNGTDSGNLTNNEAIKGLNFVTSSRGGGDRGCYNDADGNYVLGGSYYAVNEKEDATDKYLRLSFPVFGDFLTNGRLAYVDFKEAYTATETTDIVMDFDLKLTNGMTHGAKGANPVLRIGTADTDTKTVSAVEIDKEALSIGDDWVHARIITTATGSKLYINKEEITSAASTATSLAKILLYSADGSSNGSATADLIGGYTPSDGGSYNDVDKPTYTPIADLDNVIIYSEAAGVATGESEAPGAQNQEGGATPKPTATPKVLPAAPAITAPEGVTGLETYTFDDTAAQKWALTTEERTITDISGLSIHIGSRASGGNVNTYAAVSELQTGKALELQASEFSTAGRAPRVSVDSSKPAADGVSTAMSFNVYLSAAKNHEEDASPRLYLLKDATQAGSDGAGAYRNVAAVITAVEDEVIYRGDNAESDVISAYVTPDEWHTVTFVVTPGDGVNTHRVYIDGSTDAAVKADYVATGENASSMDNLPILTVESSNGDATASFGNVVIDNLLAYQGSVDEPKKLIPTGEAAPTPSPTPIPTPTPEIIANVEMTLDADTNKVTMTSDIDAPAYLIQASYSADGKFTGVKAIKNVSLKGGTAVTATLDSIAGGDKIMLWGNLSSIRPFAEVVIAPEKTPEPTATPTPTPIPTAAPVTVLNEAFTSGSVTNPTDSSYTWGSELATSGNLTTSGLMLTNSDNATNNYANRSLVTFADVIGDLTHKVNISYDVSFMNKSKGQAYNYYTIGYYDADGKLIFSLAEAIGNWADKAVLTYADSATTTATVDLGTNVGKKVDMEISYTPVGGMVTVNDTPYTFVSNGGIKDVKISVSGSRDYSRGIYVKNYKMTTTEVEYVPTCIVTYDVDGKSSTDVVEENKSVDSANIPDTTKNGWIFMGWSTDGSSEYVEGTEYISNDALKAMTISENKSFTAVYKFDESYVQTIATIEFVDEKGNKVEPEKVTAFTYPTGDNAIEAKPYKMKVTSNIGLDLTDACTYAWDIVGNEADDGYAVMDETVTTSTNNFNIKQGGDSHFGYIKVTATYDPANSDDDSKNTSATTQVPFAVIAGAKADNQIIPAAGYPVSMDDYADSLIGYVATSDDYANGYDPVLNNWCIVGSSGTRDLLLVKEGDKKAIKITNVGGNRGTGGSSTVGTMAFSPQTQQYVLETTVKFGGEGARIGVWDKTPNNANVTSEWAISYSAGALTAGDQSITGLTADGWYKVVVSSDPVNHLYSVYVYDMSGKLVGSVEEVAGNACTAKFLCVDGGFPVYINSLKVYVPTVDSISVVSDTDVVRVPENEADPANTVALTALCKTADGIKLTGKVDWKLAQEYQGVKLETSTQTAVLKISNGAAGTVDVIASFNGKSVTKTITLTNSSNVVSFKNSQSSITIPFSGSENVTAEYKADTITPDNPDGINDTTITYSFLDKTGAVAMETLPNGISSKVEGGVLTLTVEPNATPAIFYIKATNSEGLSTKTQVNVHGLSYQFGTTVEEGYTQVTSATLYNETLGYGFESTTGLTDGENSVTGTAVYKFKAKVPNGNYDITVQTTSATMQSEIVDEVVAIGALMPGISKSGSNFSVAVCDGVLDLSFLANTSVTSLSIAQSATKAEREKPAIFAIGDSTTKANMTGARSWAECASDGDVKPSDKFISFSNNGMAGRDSVNFYNQGRIESVLLSVCPGDYVTVNMGINSRTENINEWGAYPILIDTYYVKAIMDRGAIPVIVTATPQGPVNNYASSNYNATTGFDCDRGTGARNDELRKVAQKYDLNILELGYWANDYFNSLTMEDVAAYNAANGTSFTTVLQLVQSWYPDHNHYARPLGQKIAEYIFNALDEIESGSDKYNQANDTHINEQ